MGVVLAAEIVAFDCTRETFSLASARDIDHLTCFKKIYSQLRTHFQFCTLIAFQSEFPELATCLGTRFRKMTGQGPADS